MRIVLIGMPGVGKGTQAVRLRETIAVPHVSTGDLLREAVQDGSPLGRKVRGFLESGALVPDDVMGELIGERLSRADARKGFVLDGFPRTAEQVAILDRVLERLGVRLDRVLLIVAPEAEVVRRLSGRRVCPRCHEVYHVDNRPPRSAGVCDACGSALVQRRDDAEDVVAGRMEVFRRQTLPLVDIYRGRGELVEIDGMGSPDAVFARMQASLERV